MGTRIRELVDEKFQEFVEIRRDFHRNPELSLEEFRTADKIEECLRRFGIKVGERINKTSVVGVLDSGDKGASAIGLRADIDALPIQQLSNPSYRSQNDGVMHACGHDVHTTIQLGAAYVLSQLKDELPAPVKFFFQQAEETVGGAVTMIEAGVLENPHVSHVIGMHVDPTLEVGTLGIKYGTGYASSDNITIAIHGKSAHGASPHEGIDAIVLAGHLIVALQTLISRNTSPLDAAVLSFGTIEGGTASNIIANAVTLTGTLRTLNHEVREKLKQRIEETTRLLTQSYGGNATCIINEDYDAVVNDEKTTKIVEKVARTVFGEEQTILLDYPSLGVEDFAYFAKVRPSSYNRLGVGNKEKGITAPVHDGNFDIDEEAIRYGILLQVKSVLALMGVE